MTLTQNRKGFYTAIAAATLMLACMTITSAASAQTFNPQQPPDFGDFNGTRPDFGGNMSFPGGGMGQGGDFNGTFPGRDDGNFTRPDFSGAPNQYDTNNAGSSAQVSGSETDYTLIFAAVVVVVGIVAVVAAVFVRRKRSGSSVHPSSAEKKVSENFDF